jgi:diguanylate cyclase (GGDEF)-like protein
MVKTSTVGGVVLKITLIISICELLIILVLGNIPHTMSGKNMVFSSIAFLAFLNTLLLIITASPLIYYWVISPFVKARDDAISHATHLAYYDQLTNLGNRRLIYQNLEKMVARCERRNVFGAVLLIDLNKFKPINDEYGHDAGDAILISVAKELENSIRNEDVVGRFGGDEFVVLINHLDVEEKISKDKVLTVIKNIQAAISISVEFKGVKLQVGSSIGVCLFNKSEGNIDDLIKRADVAMYDAKKNSTEVAIYSIE